MTEAAIQTSIIILMITGVFGESGSLYYTPHTICALQGFPVEMNCYFLSRHEKVSLKWIHIYNDQTLDVSQKYKGGIKVHCWELPECSLHIHSVKNSDAGNYYCNITSNIPNLMWSGPSGVSLSVTDLHVVTSGRVKEGDNVTLTCSTTCNLTSSPLFIWSKDGRPVEKRIINNQLQLHPVSYEDEGNYTCAVRGKEDFPSALYKLQIMNSEPGVITDNSQVYFVCIVHVVLFFGLLGSAWIAVVICWKCNPSSQALQDRPKLCQDEDSGHSGSFKNHYSSFPQSHAVKLDEFNGTVNPSLDQSDGDNDSVNPSPSYDQSDGVYGNMNPSNPRSDGDYETVNPSPSYDQSDGVYGNMNPSNPRSDGDYETVNPSPNYDQSDGDYGNMNPSNPRSDGDYETVNPSPSYYQSDGDYGNINPSNPQSNGNYETVNPSPSYDQSDRDYGNMNPSNPRSDGDYETVNPSPNYDQSDGDYGNINPSNPQSNGDYETVNPSPSYDQSDGVYRNIKPNNPQSDGDY